MADTPVYMGFEGRIYYGTAGTTASTEMTEESVDISYAITPDRSPSHGRGAGTTPPLKCARVTAIGMKIDFSVLNKPASKTTLQTLAAAAAAGTPIALRTKDYALGKGFDGDVTLEYKGDYPRDGEQAHAFTAEPTNEKGRPPQAYV